MLIELRKWLFAGADFARQPLLVFCGQKQKMEVRRAADSMGCVVTRCRLRCPAKEARGVVSVKEERVLRKIQVVPSPIFSSGGVEV